MAAQKAVKPGKKAKQERNPERTRARILGVATDLFAVGGYNGCSLDDIVKAARVNKRMVYHYFEDKFGLYRAVILLQWGELKIWFDEAMLERLSAKGLPQLNAGTMMSEVISILSDFIASNPKFVRLMMWEGLEGGHVSKTIWTEARGPLFAQVEFLVKTAQEEGLIDSELDSAHLVISFLGAVSFYFAYASAMTDIVHADPMTPAQLEKRKQQVMLLLQSLFRRPVTRKPRAARA